MAFNFEESKNDRKQDIAETVWVVVWGLVAIFSGFFALTRGHGLEEQKFFIIFVLFGVMILAFMIFAITIKFAQYLGYLEDFYLPIFDPEKGAFPIKSGMKFLFGALLFVSILGLVASFAPQSTFKDFAFPLKVGGVEQQVTKGAKVLYGGYNSPAENAFLYVILAGLVTLEFILCKMFFGWKKKTIFLAFLLPNIVLGSFAWLEIHDLVSKDNSLKEFSHFTFGAEMSASVLLTGTIIYPEVRHLFNNVFITILEQFGQGLTIAIFLALVIIFLIINVAIYTTKKE